MQDDAQLKANAVYLEWGNMVKPSRPCACESHLTARNTACSFWVTLTETQYRSALL